MADEKWPRNDEGKLIDPPTLPEYEQKINAAAAAADEKALALHHEQYHEAREQYVRDLEGSDATDTDDDDSDTPQGPTFGDDNE